MMHEGVPLAMEHNEHITKDSKTNALFHYNTERANQRQAGIFERFFLIVAFYTQTFQKVT